MKNTTMVTYLKAMSFGSVSSIPFTAPARFFISLSVRVVEVRSVMVGWFMCNQCVSPDLYALRRYRIPNKVSKETMSP